MKAQHIFYRQCSLEKKNLKSVAWIPEKFAKLNSFVQIKQKDDSWDDGWQVVLVGSTRQSHADVIHYERAWTRHRKATDI